MLPAHLELWLDQSQAVERLGGARERRGQHLPEGDEGDVEHDQVGSVRKLLATQGPGVPSLDHRHPRVGPEPPVELTVGDVDGHNVLDPALEQAVGESAGRGPYVEGQPSGDIEPEAGERVGELDPAPGDELGSLVHLDLDALGNELAGLLGPPALREQQDVARQHRGGRAGTRWKNAPLREQGVQTDSLHRLNRT